MVDASGIVDRQLQRLDSSEGIQLLHVRNSGQERAILAAEEAVDEQLPLTGNAPASDTVLKSTRSGKVEKELASTYSLLLPIDWLIGTMDNGTTMSFYALLYRFIWYRDSVASLNSIMQVKLSLSC